MTVFFFQQNTLAYISGNDLKEKCLLALDFDILYDFHNSKLSVLYAYILQLRHLKVFLFQANFNLGV